ncbi:glycosyltransferase [Carboxylicivirga marina]|uniref:glycosyltransferase n=1 Tax=Carboxylicivirga marina TaxID=2800988 RepID=UPI0025943D3D|nr:glycosyltransferase [uncultured Carboxylicivirga sp.]
MHILFEYNTKLPAILYGGIQRIVWDLAKELSKLNHKVTLLVKEGSYCDFADVIYYDTSKPLNEQIPDDVDVVHMCSQPKEAMHKPYIAMRQVNTMDANIKLDINTSFVSKNHAARFGSDVYVHNCLDWNNFLKPELNSKREYLHFLAKAAWKVKNVKGSIKISRKAKEKLVVMGGTRLNFKMGFRFTPYPSISFTGMVDNAQKSKIMNQSKGLLFPVVWHEPFGIALIESLYFGCPVMGTPYGSLPELIHDEVGFLSSSSDELAQAVKDIDAYSKHRCHEYAQEVFNAKVMTQHYLKLYEKVLNGETLNKKEPQLVNVQPSKHLPFN